MPITALCAVLHHSTYVTSTGWSRRTARKAAMDGETSDLGPIFTICFRGATSLRHFPRVTLSDAAVLADMLQLFRR